MLPVREVRGSTPLSPTKKRHFSIRNGVFYFFTVLRNPGKPCFTLFFPEVVAPAVAPENSSTPFSNEDHVKKPRRCVVGNVLVNINRLAPKGSAARAEMDAYIKTARKTISRRIRVVGEVPIPKGGRSKKR